MAQNHLALPVSITITQELYEKLFDYLFPGDDDEHGAVIVAGICESSRGTRLLVREVHWAEEGKDYVEGKSSYRELTAAFVTRNALHCADERLCYLAVHCHPGSGKVSFSDIDLKSQQRGYPALLDITDGGPVGALVFSQDAVAGRIWTQGGVHTLSHMTIVGSSIKRLSPSPDKNVSLQAPLQYHRQTLLFGNLGQEILRGLKVGIIGLGGSGSLINEWIARLGVGYIVAVDPERLDPTNLPRVVGATRRDAVAYPIRALHPRLSVFFDRFCKYKVAIARRVALQANPNVVYEAIAGNVIDDQVAEQLKDVDFLFLASDTMQSRVVFNALVYQYLIPGAEVGAKVTSDPQSGSLANIHVVSRPVFPAPGHGCLHCRGLISPDKLAEENMTEREWHAQKYTDDEQVNAPSVIALNALACAPVVNDFMMMFTGLYAPDIPVREIVYYPLERQWYPQEQLYKDNCRDCATATKSRFGRGDRMRLPCRITAS